MLAGQPEAFRPFHGGIRAFPLPNDKGASEAVTDAHRLYAEYERRSEHVAEVEQAAVDAEQAVHVAHAAYQAEVQRSAEAGEVSTLDADLLAKRESAMAEANPEIHGERRHAAIQLRDEAGRAYLDHVQSHALDFLALIAPEAEQVTEEYTELAEEHAKRIMPVEARHKAIRGDVAFLIGGNMAFRPGDLPADPTDCRTAPLPSDEALVRARAMG